MVQERAIFAWTKLQMLMRSCNKNHYFCTPIITLWTRLIEFQIRNMNITILKTRSAVFALQLSPDGVSGNLRDLFSMHIFETSKKMILWCNKICDKKFFLEYTITLDVFLSNHSRITNEKFSKFTANPGKNFSVP